ncbi:MAG: HIT domain-containing protein [Xanthomonadaceae bacterium]|nr:HIT domain-containing protein [Rhodospirillaceae bacterium]NIA17842.1 HIT domain-containing protein [Xanthomonadaceae bacterium]
MDCIFCKIIKGEIPCYKVYENKDFFAFLDIRPLNPGHTLIIPKKHYRWVWDVPNIGEYYKVVRKIARAIKKAFKTDYVVSLIFGEEIEHAHIWLVPRFKNDGHGASIDLKNVKQLSEQEMKNSAKKIIDQLNRGW